LAMIPSSRSADRQKNGHRAALPRAAFLDENSGEASEALAKKASSNGWLRVDSAFFQRSPLSEAFRSLRTSVLLSTATHPPRSLAFVSAEPGEGKTTICNNLAITLAQLGKRVLVIDGDMRRPSVHRFFHIEQTQGLVNYLTDDVDWRGLVQPTEIKGLDCLVCGFTPPNPSELLSSERMKMLVDEAAVKYDLVLLSTIVEGTILVVKGSSTPREMVRRAEVYISNVGGHLLGVVLNDVNMRRDGYYYSAYEYYAYGPESSGKQKS
jgi:capsular exopolysaccharide synthesis family protein